eukprot:356974_1
MQNLNINKHRRRLNEHVNRGISLDWVKPHEIHQQYVRDCCVYSEFHGQRDDLSVQQTQNVLKGMNWQSSVFDLPLLIDTEQWKSQFVKILNYDPKQQHQMNRMYSYLWCFETLIRLNPELLKIQILQTKHLVHISKIYFGCIHGSVFA